MKSFVPHLVILLFLISCSVEEDDPPVLNVTPDIFIRDSRVFEQSGQSIMQFEVVTSFPVETPIDFSFAVEGLSATPGEDFVAGNGSSIIGANSQMAVIPVTILDDQINEVDEKIKVTLTGANNATIGINEAFGVIQDNDEPSMFDDEGYLTPDLYFGYQLQWGDEFSSEKLDSNIYNYDLGDGCPNLCTWGNGELQWYTEDTENVNLADGLLSITATKTGAANFRSGRINTKNKQTFQYGRIDVRAKFPEGNSLLPAIWMLGSNIDEVSWPACGEIDIIEVFGDKPNNALGTAHWGPQGSMTSISNSKTFNSDEGLNERFFVYSLVWEEDEIKWYVDETLYQTITPDDMQGQAYPFNQPFYFLMNVAVGGHGQENPDDTVLFPVTLEIDYIRVFQ